MRVRKRNTEITTTNHFTVRKFAFCAIVGFLQFASCGLVYKYSIPAGGVAQARAMWHYRTVSLVTTDLTPPMSLDAKLDYRSTNSNGCKDSIAVHNLTKISKMGRGDCFFASIALAVYGSEQKHGQVRQEICDFMQHHLMTAFANSPDSLSLCYDIGLFENITAERFRRKMMQNLHTLRQPGQTNSGQMEVSVAAHVYRLNTVVFNRNDSRIEKKDTNGNPILSREGHQQYERDESGRFIRRGWEAMALTQPDMKILGPHANPPSIQVAISQPIMLLYEYSKGIVLQVGQKEEEDVEYDKGHYSLLKYMPNSNPRGTGGAAGGVAGGAAGGVREVAAKCIPRQSAAYAVVGDSAMLARHHKEHDEQYALLVKLLDKSSGGSVSAPVDVMEMSVNIQECTLRLQAAKLAIQACKEVQNGERRGAGNVAKWVQNQNHERAPAAVSPNNASTRSPHALREQECLRAIERQKYKIQAANDDMDARTNNIRIGHTKSTNKRLEL